MSRLNYSVNPSYVSFQLNSVPSTILPVFLEFVRNNCPQSVTVTVKEVKQQLHQGLINPGDKNISILYLSCRTSDLQFSLVLQTHALVL